MLTPVDQVSSLPSMVYQYRGLDSFLKDPLRPFLAPPESTSNSQPDLSSMSGEKVTVLIGPHSAPVLLPELLYAISRNTSGWKWTNRNRKSGRTGQGVVGDP